MAKYRVRAERTDLFSVEVEADSEAQAKEKALLLATTAWDYHDRGYLDIFETEILEKEAMVKYDDLKVGDILVANYNKPTEHVLTVSQKGETDWGTPWVELVDKDAVYQLVKEFELKFWDLTKCG